jgi:hypothetical protein
MADNIQEIAQAIIQIALLHYDISSKKSDIN